MEEKFGISTKKYMLKELKEKLASSEDFIITGYKGVSSINIEKLRKNLAKADSGYFVVKNSIAKRAFNELGLKDLEELLKGEVGISFTKDAIKSAKALMGFAKEHKTFRVSSAYIDGKVEAQDRIKYLAALPSKEVLLALAVGGMKAPITGFVGVLNGLLRNLVYVINEIKNKQGKQESKEGGKRW